MLEEKLAFIGLLLMLSLLLSIVGSSLTAVLWLMPKEHVVEEIFRRNEVLILLSMARIAA